MTTFYREGQPMKSDSCTRAVLAVIAATLVLTLVYSPSVAQQDTHWLVGKWRGEQWSGAGSSRDRTAVEVVFRDESGKIQWELEVVSAVGIAFGAKAAGTATLSGESLSMRGQYTAGGPGLGAPLSYLLQRNGEDELTGTGLGRTQATFNTGWKKIK